MITRVCLCILIYVPTVSFAQTDDEKKASIKYVQSLQQPDGGFVGSLPGKEKPSSSLRATSSAIRTLHYLGGELPNKEKTVKFVESCFDPKTGGYADAPMGPQSVFLTAVGIMAAAELKLEPSVYISKSVRYLAENAKGFEELRIGAAGMEAANQFPKEPIDIWLANVKMLRNEDGSYGKPVDDARMTGSVVAMILRVGGKMDDAQRKESLNVLRRGQRDDGAYGKAEAKASDLETTYRVMRAFHMLNEKPTDVAKLREFIGKCRNADGGYGVAPGQPSSVGGTYFASIIGLWLK